MNEQEQNYGSQRHRQMNSDEYDFGRQSPQRQGRYAARSRNEYDDAQRGQRDSDWADDIATRAGGRMRNTDEYDDEFSYRNTSRQPQRQQGNRDYRRHDDYNDMQQTHRSFRKRHPVLMNLLYIILCGGMLLWMLLWFLDFWTFHGEERVVPDVKGLAYENAAGNVDISGLRAVISDSVFDSSSHPGTVVEQTPIPGARIKKGGTVYLTIVAFSPKLITVPDFYNASARQARSMFEGLGIKDIREVPVTSEYAGLVLGAKFNGVALQPGARIPVSAIVTIEVGTGWDDTIMEAEDSVETAIDDVIDELNIE